MWTALLREFTPALIAMTEPLTPYRPLYPVVARPSETLVSRAQHRTDSEKLASLSLSLMLVAMLEALHSLTVYVSDILP